MSCFPKPFGFHQNSHEAFCRKDIDNLLEWFSAIEQDGSYAPLR